MFLQKSPIIFLKNLYLILLLSIYFSKLTVRLGVREYFGLLSKDLCWTPLPIYVDY